MGDVHVSVYVTEDVALDEHVQVNDAGEPYGWLYLGTFRDAALWGSPAGLRRLAAALVLLAERAEGMGVLRCVAKANGSGHRGDETGLPGVRGS